MFNKDLNCHLQYSNIFLFQYIIAVLHVYYKQLLQIYACLMKVGFARRVFHGVMIGLCHNIFYVNAFS